MRFAKQPKTHIFDNRFSSIGVLVSLPFLWAERRWLTSHISHNALVAIMFITIVAISSIVAQLVGAWWYKRRIEQYRSKGYKL